MPNTQFLAEKVAMLAEALEELEDEDTQQGTWVGGGGVGLLCC